MNFAQDAKGFVKMDVTVEYETPEKTAENAAKAIDLYRKTVAEKGLVLLSPW
jgi:hypothetical protein